MPNGSLNSFLFAGSQKLLEWKTRFEIALGTARALVYLHEECRDQIIHSDIKPENILLDSDFTAKIADFGLAKLVGRDFSRVLTSMRGTQGYIAPEWLAGLAITSKADVYSFGMMVLEIISGRRNVDMSVKEQTKQYFPSWAATQIQNGDMMSILDERIAEHVDVEEVRRATLASLVCIAKDENERPSMAQVLLILHGKMDADTQLKCLAPLGWVPFRLCLIWVGNKLLFSPGDYFYRRYNVVKWIGLQEICLEHRVDSVEII
ncbi:G-type lectin S-receptor-like serine/threonine-protein kinase At2g19130 [Cryptomeria japonica]|uniref:G-type lectin S-receptor-like serine/threonine-protein kinase At2g19130 n=1 Tax=Cryptomeria japonica TaxID=3369 RepID=UPI0027DA4AA4|nr:G-type lectin S-receptor-like serine/threonine-protein kinase At2g19130 [Cryptomeria japonica]